MRAKYGEDLIKALSTKLTERYGRGFSESNIHNMRQFYVEYQPGSSNAPIHYTLCSKSQSSTFFLHLGWSHYRETTRVKRIEARAVEKYLDEA